MGKGVFIICCVLAHATFCQELKELRHCVTSEYKCDFYVSLSDKKIKYQDTLHYFWYKAKKIHVTQGASEGYELHGPYTKFYHSGQLAEQGEFREGLKDGIWKEWYESGRLKSIYNYNRGELSGSYRLYNEAGDLRESGKIRRGQKKVKFKRPKKTKSDQKKKKKKKIWDGASHPDKETIRKREEKKQERMQRREERKKLRDREGDFITRWINKMKEKRKEKKKSKRQDD